MNSTNWRTSIAGAAAAAVGLARVFLPPKYAPVIDAVVTILVFFGLYNAADKQNVK